MLEDDQPVQISITPSQADELLAKLAEDDDFRGELEADPQGVLARYGIVLPEQALRGETMLPSKEEVQDAVLQMGPSELHPEAGVEIPIFRRFIALLIFLRFREP